MESYASRPSIHHSMDKYFLHLVHVFNSILDVLHRIFSNISSPVTYKKERREKKFSKGEKYFPVPSPQGRCTFAVLYQFSAVILA